MAVSPYSFGNVLVYLFQCHWWHRQFRQQIVQTLLHADCPKQWNEVVERDVLIYALLQMADGREAYARSLCHLFLADSCSKPILLQPLAQEHYIVLVCCVTFSSHMVIYCYFSANLQINIHISLYCTLILSWQTYFSFDFRLFPLRMMQMGKRVITVGGFFGVRRFFSMKK